MVDLPANLEEHALSRFYGRLRAEALNDARRALWRALECDSSMLRADYLYRARDALKAAGQPRWADLAEAAAGRIGGDDTGVRRLLFDVDCAVSRQEHAA